MKSESQFSLVSPNSFVDVHLADGRVISGPRGAKAAEFLQAIDLKAPVVAAVVDNELRELTFPIHKESNMRPITTADPDGARIYRRSLNFMLEMAFTELFPRAKLTIDHSISFGGYYCQVSGRKSLTTAELERLSRHMREWVRRDLPIEKMEVPLKAAIQYFKSMGYQDKVHLLRYRRKGYLTLYKFGKRMDYHHGYMVPSTGYLKWFKLSAASGGFTLQFPRRHTPSGLQRMQKYPKLLAAFRQYGDWLSKLEIDNVGALNDAIGSGRMDELVLVSEALHELNVSDIAQRIVKHRSRIILIAGPSSSGKTTFSRRLAIQLLAQGVSPFPLELDNYFVERAKTKLGSDGKPDFESIRALDLKLLSRHILRLIDGRPVRLPRYNFKTGLRESGEIVQLNKNQPIIFEGIHGLNPNLIPGSLTRRSFKIYVSALTQINLDRHNRVSTTDTRLIRRIVRDARERGYSAVETISRWESVRQGEKRYIFPYQENCDVMFNSATVYELSALKPKVEPLLRMVPFGIPEYIEAKRLLAFLEWFLPIDDTLVPENSIVKEFLGDSILKDFKIWK